MGKSQQSEGSVGGQAGADSAWCIARDAVDDSAQARVLAEKIAARAAMRALRSQVPAGERAGTIKRYDFPTAHGDNVLADAGASAPKKSPNGAADGSLPYRVTFLSDRDGDRDDILSEVSGLAFGSSPDGGIVGSESEGSPPIFRPGDPQVGDGEFEQREVVIDANGQPRQAGAMMPEGEFIKRFRVRAEQSLYIFLKGVLGRFFLTPHFHREACAWLQRCPPFRKLKLMPREHAKTTIVAGGLPPHILIQPAATNIYFPGLEGSECRILLAGETETMAKKNLRVVQSVFEENKIFRAFWPHRCWDNARQAKSWSSESIIIPRANEWPDPTIRAVGVGGAITGARPNVMIKDDLVSFKAANSEVVMDEAIEWHRASRALLDKYEVESGLQSLEFIIGTRWAVYDLYSYIIDNDPSVEVNSGRFHKIVRDGRILWPEKYTMADIEQLRTEHGSNFFLLYLNSAADPELTDFNLEDVRDFRIVQGNVVFEHDERDLLLEKKVDARKARERGEVPPPQLGAKQALNAAVMQRLIDSGAQFRLRAA